MVHIEKTFIVNIDFHLADICLDGKVGFLNEYNNEGKLCMRHFASKKEDGNVVVTTYYLVEKDGVSFWKLLGELPAKKICNHPWVSNNLKHQVVIFEAGYTLPDITTPVTTESWIVWNKESKYPPTKIWESESQATKVCREMTRKTGLRFFACKLTSVSDIQKLN